MLFNGTQCDCLAVYPSGGLGINCSTVLTWDILPGLHASSPDVCMHGPHVRGPPISPHASSRYVRATHALRSVPHSVSLPPVLYTLPSITPWSSPLCTPTRPTHYSHMYALHHAPLTSREPCALPLFPAFMCTIHSCFCMPSPTPFPPQCYCARSRSLLIWFACRIM